MDDCNDKNFMAVVSKVTYLYAINRAIYVTNV